MSGPGDREAWSLSSRETDNYVYGYFSSVMEDKHTALIKLFKLYDRGINIQLGEKKSFKVYDRGKQNLWEPRGSP